MTAALLLYETKVALYVKNVKGMLSKTLEISAMFSAGHWQPQLLGLFNVNLRRR